MERRLTAILAADVVGYSKLMAEDEEATLVHLKAHRAGLFDPQVSEHNGRIIKLMGDGTLVEFASVVDAVNCAIAIQSALAQTSGPIQLRIGVNLGDVMVDGDDIYGDGVNVASRLEALAEPGGVCISDMVHQNIRAKLEITFKDLGEQSLKNIEQPIRAWQWSALVAKKSNATDANSLALPDKPSIAVLAFTNMSGDPEQEYVSDGISEDIITALSKISKLFVVARNSTFTYKGRAVDVKQVGREQGVRYVLEGSVRRGGDRLRITAQLIDATTGHHLWAQRYDRVMQDVFELQDEITREVISALQVELTEGEQARLWATGTKNLEAWEIVIQIPELLYGHRRGDVHKARHLAEQALQLDEHYAAAWAMLGMSHYEDAFNGWTDTPDVSLDLALQAAERSRSIDDTNPDTLATLAFIHLSLCKHDEATELGQGALLLGPNNSFVAGCVANVALYCNRPREMASLTKKAMRLCPIYPAWYVGDLGWAYLLMDRRDDAIATVQEAVKLDPDYIYTYMVLAISQAELGCAEKAAAAVENILRIEPEYSLQVFARSQPFRDAAVLRRHLEGLRKAGLPE